MCPAHPTECRSPALPRPKRRSGTANRLPLAIKKWPCRAISAHDKVNGPGISSAYLKCIEEPSANRRDCKARAEWFREEARSEFRAGWPWFALGPVLIVWLLVYSVVWTARWIRRGLQPSA